MKSYDQLDHRILSIRLLRSSVYRQSIYKTTQQTKRGQKKSRLRRQGQIFGARNISQLSNKSKNAMEAMRQTTLTRSTINNTVLGVFYED
ncbi:hypothetical protein SK128_007884 [Halocaridina rubra]|uniref:Uncharacterized protein n=1 Tax=Halocaridina rubra TaxID=373956 RepID=A0AAN8ZY60_HALRR